MIRLSALVAGALLASVVSAQDPLPGPRPQARVVPIEGTDAQVRLVTEGTRTTAAVSRDGGRTWAGIPHPEPVIRWRDRSFDLAAGDAALSPLLRSPASNLHYVQFVTDVLPEYRVAVEALGGQVGPYIPNSALMVRMSPATAARVQAQAWVRAVGPVHAGHKLDAPIAAALLDGRATKARYNVMLFDKRLDARAAEAAVVAAGGRVVLGAEGGRVFEAVLDPAQLVTVAASDTVLFVDAWSAPEDDIDLLRVQAGVNYVETAAGIDGKGMRGHILEGVYATHPEFAARPPYRTAPISLRNGSGSGHGTNTAGEIYARGANSQYKGILPYAQLLYTNYSAVYNNTVRYPLTQDLVDQFQPYKATFQTASWGYARTLDYTTRSAEMDDILFDFPRIFVTQSQSNAGGTTQPRASRPQAWAKNVASVGGFLHYNNTNPGDDCWCRSGSTGPAADGRIGVTFAAYYDSIGTTNGSTGYTNGFGGTSGATPIVNGLGGGAIQMFTDGMFGYPKFDWQNRHVGAPNLTTTHVLLALGSRQLPLSRSTRVQQGWGLPNLRDLYDNRDNILLLDEEDVLKQGETRSYFVFVRPGTPEFRASMHHLEDAAAPLANPTRINSLDLKVTAPDGRSYWGNNGLSTALVSSPGGSPNDLDIHENVILEKPAPGMYEVAVTAAMVRADNHKETQAVDVDFALGVRGVGGGRDRSGPTLDLVSSRAGQLDVKVTRPTASWTSGWTLFSLATSRHVSLGNVFGLEADDLTLGILGVAPSAGNVFAFTNTSNSALYPNATFAFPSVIASALKGREIDAVALFVGAGGLVDVTNVDRVKVQ